jgi:thiamine biosynthesis lipoprotein
VIKYKQSPYFLLLIFWSGFLLWSGCTNAESDTDLAKSSSPVEKTFFNSGRIAVSILADNATYGFRGETMGTNWTVTSLIDITQGSPKDSLTLRQILEEADELLAEFNTVFSTYDPNSKLSQAASAVPSNWNSLNLAGHQGKWLSELYKISNSVYQASDGSFDPTIMPLVRYWGFFKEDPFSGAQKPDSIEIDKRLKLVDFSALTLTEDGTNLVSLRWPVLTELDFNAVAKGQGVDLLAAYFESKGFENLLVEIGGEVVAKGKNDKGNHWNIAVEKPTEGVREFMALVSLPNKAMATSGNYRKFWEKEGQKYGHTLNPKTGWPEKSNLLSATVIADNCASADAWATACMVLGLDKAINKIEADSSLDAMFINLDNDGNYVVFQTTGFDQYIAARN